MLTPNTTMYFLIYLLLLFLWKLVGTNKISVEIVFRVIQQTSDCLY